MFINNKHHKITFLSYHMNIAMIILKSKDIIKVNLISKTRVQLLNYLKEKHSLKLTFLKIM